MINLDLYTDKTYLAILGSIGKWADILRGRIVDLGSSNCPLCQLYSSCAICPVALSVTETGCNGTPYAKYNYYKEKTDALAMYYFLIEVKEWYIGQKIQQFIKERELWQLF